MKTIKIKKIPTKFRGSGYKTGQQLPNYSMYKGEYPGEGSQKPVENPDSNNVKDLKIRDSEPKVDKKDATIEAEKGEVKIGKDLQTLRKIGGKKHSQGGTPLAPDPGDFIVSNTIEFNPQIAEALGLDTDVKDGTSWAKYLKKKVDPKTFNTYASLLDNKAKGRDNDPYFEKDAVIQLPDFQMIASKVALANELTKAVDGKDFDIPQVAQLAIQEVSQNPPQKNRNPNLETQAQTMQGFSKSASRTLKMKNGGTVPKYPNGGTIDSVSTWFPNYPGTPKKDRNNSLI